MDSGNIENHSDIIQFEHFDVVPEPSDHHFLPSNVDNRAKRHFSDSNSSVFASIMKEWKILNSNLPDSIYVQAYETRIDLLRAVIVGPSGTPYHDGLFFFDICLPYDYPKQPPKVYYRSHGHRLNPNLYSNGTVCLSLINTWHGTKVEKWTQKSTLLQILVSIQGLVLNERPYFNEPGYEVGINSKDPKWVDPSITYNQDAFIRSCKTMVHIMQKPPVNFENFVAQHFRVQAHVILEAIKDYLDGRVMVGQCKVNGACSSSSRVKVSEKFVADLRKVRSDLEMAFSKMNHVEDVVKVKPEEIVEKHDEQVVKKQIVKPEKIVKKQEQVVKPKQIVKKDEQVVKKQIVKLKQNVKKDEKGFLSSFVSFVEKIWK